MRISSELRDLVAASALSALLFTTGVLVPLVGPPAGFVATAPLIWLAARHGRLAGALGGLVATAALLSGLPPPVALIFAIEHALPAWYLGWIVRRDGGVAAASARAAVVVTTLVIGAALLLATGGQDPVQVLEQQLREGLAELGGGSPAGPSGTGAPAPLGAGLEEVVAFMRRVLPAVTLIGIFLECSLNTLLAARLLARVEGAARPRDMTAFSLPDWVVWVLIPVLALCWAPVPDVATVALNLALPLLFAYLLVGLSISLHLAVRARFSRFGRTLLVSAFVFFPWLLAGPLLLGMLDFRFSFRNRWPIEPPAA